MNYSTAVLLVSEQVKAIGVKFGTSGGSLSGKEYVYKTTEDVELGDLVLVQTDDNIYSYKVVEVTNLDPEVPFEGDRKIKWIVQKVDLTLRETNEEREAEVVEKVMQANKKSKREQLRDMLMASVSDEDKKLLTF